MVLLNYGDKPCCTWSRKYPSKTPSTPEQLKVLDSMPDNVSASEIVQKLDIQGDIVDSIRAEKTAKLIEEVIPSLNE